MRILAGPELFKKQFANSALTIGNFDGVHRGHLELLRILKRRSQELGFHSVVVTFNPHPLVVLAPESAPTLITTFGQKASLIEAEGIDCLAVIEFSLEFSKLSAESFVHEVLLNSLGMRHIVIGHDYAFGRGREGNFATLTRIGNERGFTLEDLEPVGDDGQVFSSSLVRRLIADGDVSGASRVLGRYHILLGRVRHGRKMGRQIGFPTANISTLCELIPPNGVYAVMVGAGGGSLCRGVCNIGVNPTFGGVQRSIEVFLIDFSGQIYDQELVLCFVERIREEKKFSGADSLIEAINQDIVTTRTILDSADGAMAKCLFATGSET